MASYNPMIVLAITSEVGAGSPEAQALNGVRVGAAQSLGGSTPFFSALGELGRYGNPIGPRTRFAGQDGETPLTFAMRRL